MKIISTNKKAFHEFEILDKYEAGIELFGSEVKAIRAGKLNLRDSFVRIMHGEAFLMGAHISYLETTNKHIRHEETRVRKLLLHRKEIDKLFGKVSQKGLALVALKVYFNTSNRVKIEIALAKGKTDHDKRETLKQKEADREAKAAIKERIS